MNDRIESGMVRALIAVCAIALAGCETMPAAPPTMDEVRSADFGERPTDEHVDQYVDSYLFLASRMRWGATTYYLEDKNPEFLERGYIQYYSRDHGYVTHFGWIECGTATKHTQFDEPQEVWYAIVIDPDIRLELAQGGNDVTQYAEEGNRLTSTEVVERGLVDGRTFTGLAQPSREVDDRERQAQEACEDIGRGARKP